MSKEDPQLLICCISTGQRIIGNVVTLEEGIRIHQPFTVEEMIIESEDGDFISTQVSLVYYMAYSKNESVVMPKNHLICAMEPTDEMTKCYQAELESVQEQKAEKTGVKRESGTVVAFKKKN